MPLKSGASNQRAINKLYRAGRKRKNLAAKRSTLSAAELFACLDAPPAAKADKPAK